jgi:flagellar protein FlaJ
MSRSIEQDVQEIIELVGEIKAQKQYRDQFLSLLSQAHTPAEQEVILRGRPKQEHLEYYNKYLLELFGRMDRANQRIMAECEEPQQQELPATPTIVQKKGKKGLYVSASTRKKYLKEIGASEQTLKRILHSEKEKKGSFEEVEYTLYQQSLYGKLANVIFGGMSAGLIRSHPKLFNDVSRAIRSSNLRVLSKTYLSMMILTGVGIGMLSFLLTAGITVTMSMPLMFTLLSSIFVAGAGALITMGIFLLYPSLVANNRNRLMKDDLPFVIIHMAAVAGSGAKPLSMFKLIASSGEYRGLEGEIKKILNYVNLFGYNISTALKMVAATTPSPRFRDLLTGMIATMESGGSMKSYLQSMADDAMHTYSLERKKYVEVLSTYSDIYTGILIAAPLLFMVTLAIINLLGGTIGGFSVSMLAVIGTYVVIPLLNIAFVLFLNMMQPEI